MKSPEKQRLAANHHLRASVAFLTFTHASRFALLVIVISTSGCHKASHPNLPRIFLRQAEQSRMGKNPVIIIPGILALLKKSIGCGNILNVNSGCCASRRRQREGFAKKVGVKHIILSSPSRCFYN
jgi:hypothetical protein